MVKVPLDDAMILTLIGLYILDYTDKDNSCMFCCGKYLNVYCIIQDAPSTSLLPLTRAELMLKFKEISVFCKILLQGRS